MLTRYRQEFMLVPQYTSIAQPIEYFNRVATPFYDSDLQAKGATAGYIRTTLAGIRKVCKACQFKRLIDMNATSLIRWLNKQSKNGMGARTRNSYREVMVTFSNWAVENNCMVANPFSKVAKACETVDRRRQRRALTVDEIASCSAQHLKGRSMMQ